MKVSINNVCLLDFLVVLIRDTEIAVFHETILDTINNFNYIKKTNV